MNLVYHTDCPGCGHALWIELVLGMMPCKLYDDIETDQDTGKKVYHEHDCPAYYLFLDQENEERKFVELTIEQASKKFIESEISKEQSKCKHRLLYYQDRYGCRWPEGYVPYTCATCNTKLEKRPDTTIASVGTDSVTYEMLRKVLQ